MAAYKSYNFLPEIFRTETNRKFLSATVDQLINEPDLIKLDGYIGRKLAPSYKNSDSYITEIDKDRQNYQLEPSIVIKNASSNEYDFVVTYTDIINKIGFSGGITENHNRLFDNEFYSYDPKVDLDKLVNFSQYYWLENGPAPILVSSSSVPLQQTFKIIYNDSTKSYLIAGKNTIPNPSLVLARGGTYTFEINQPGNKLYIQTKPGKFGTNPDIPNLSTRDVLGVSNNGVDIGSIVFKIPSANAQSEWTSMPVAAAVDFATSLAFNELQGCLLSELEQLGGIDGSIFSLEENSVIFVNNNYIDDLFWYNTARIENNILYLDQNNLVDVSERNDVYKINIKLDNDGNERIYLTPKFIIADETKVRVRSGMTNAGREFYSRYGLFNEIPNITAPLNYLYYQSDAVDNAIGVLQIIDIAATTLDPVTEILGKLSYTSPNGIIFSNGMKIEFDSTATQPYANNIFYVEGVGTGIKLILTNNLVCEELNGDLSKRDYITINRASVDLNAWSRSNRWFHVDIIEKTAEYNNTQLILDQNTRAQRPIIEFDQGLQLFNFGREYKDPIDILDTVITRAYTQVQGIISASSSEITIMVDGESITLTSGTRIIFSNDEDLNVRNKIFNFNINLSSESPDVYKAYIEEAEDSTIEEGHSVIVNFGTNGKKQWHYNGSSWILSQQKTSINQPPVFDLIDKNGISLGSESSYPNTSFRGSKIFSYKEGSGQNDTVLGFPLSFRSINNQGDIIFENNYSIDSFSYLSDEKTVQKQISLGKLQINLSRELYYQQNNWRINSNFSKQYQIFNFVYDGITNIFFVDILADRSNIIPNVKIVVNNKTIRNGSWAFVKVVDRLAILINKELLKDGDTIFISIFNSSSISTQSFYQIPLNLDINSLNNEVTTMTLGQLRNHVINFYNNSPDVEGSVPGKSNLRNIDYLSRTGSILHHSAPSIYAGLFLTHPTMNFVDAIRLASKEYNDFKIKFLELSKNLTGTERQNLNDCVDIIMSRLNSVKNDTFPWHHSDMVPYGDKDKVTLPIYIVFDTDIRAYEISAIFNDTVCSNKAVLVYLTRTIDGVETTSLLVKDIDFYFDQTRPAIVIKDNFNLLYNDFITIVEYSNTDGSYVPETPTKLGLFPKFVPQKFVDNTYRTPIEVIRGHDGSITPAFGDFRDDVLLELERRIYNNIKVNYNPINFNLYDYIPGKFRIVDYTKKEFDKLLSQSFLKWVGTYKIEYTANNNFNSSDPFTWNYTKFKDTINGENLPGSWRSIYLHFYDTERPHTNPWEMLGFQEKPDYWESRYGPAPYTGGNFVLWSDLESGYIHGGSRAGIDLRFSRPGLTSIIPVDDNGNLRPPSEFLVADFDSSKANLSFAIGDIGPAEYAWRKSSDYPFAMQLALALGKPAQYFGLLADIQNYYRDFVTGQYLSAEKSGLNNHITPSLINVNGYLNENNETTRSAGYVNWIRDYIKNLGINNAEDIILNNLANLNVQLCYKIAGYTDKKLIRLLAEQVSPSSINDSVTVPEENYSITVYKGAPLEKITYSAVVIEKTQNGYTVSGYDINNPYFNIYSVNENNNFYYIDVGGKKIKIALSFSKKISLIPYGYEYTTIQEVVNFFVGYQQYLKIKGLLFDDREPVLNEIKDWVLSAKEFIFWSTQGWLPGNIIVLSPISNQIKVLRNFIFIDEITNSYRGSKVFDINYRPIKKNNFTVQREDGLFSLLVLSDQNIGLAEFNAVQYEHILILDNTTVFGDIIYEPQTGSRQYRMKLVGSRTGSWDGSLKLPGYLYSQSNIDTWSPGVDYIKGSIIQFKGKIYTALENILAAEKFQTNLWQIINNKIDK